MLERPTEAGGEGPPPLLLGAEGKPFILMMPFEAAERGGEARLPRLLGKEPSSWYPLVGGHSFPPTETGDKGALRPLTLMISGSVVEEEAKLLCCYVEARHQVRKWTQAADWVWTVDLEKKSQVYATRRPRLSGNWELWSSTPDNWQRCTLVDSARARLQEAGLRETFEVWTSGTQYVRCCCWWFGDKVQLNDTSSRRIKNQMSWCDDG